ncbi:MAG: outer membrane protein assembly factor BamE [Burkholderiales bacterium]
MSRALVLFLASWIAGCELAPKLTPYRMEIQQGNYVTRDMVARLKPGLTRDQVRFVLGTPLVNDIFHDERWDYVFMRQRANSPELEYGRIAVFFEEGKLKRIDGDLAAVAAPEKGEP